MIQGFDNETAPLNEYETGVLLPLLIRELRFKVGRNSAITNRYIVNTLRGSCKLSEARVRKIINHIRTNDLIPGLIATSEGYFIAESEAELLEYEESLKAAEAEIAEMVEAFRVYVQDTQIPILAEFAASQGVSARWLCEHKEFDTLRELCKTKKTAGLERSGLNNEVNARIAEFSLMQLGWSKQQAVDANVSLTVVDLLSALDTDSEVADE